MGGAGHVQATRRGHLRSGFNPDPPVRLIPPLLLIATLAGCTVWTSQPVGPGRDLPAWKVMQVWWTQGPRELHAVRIGADSLSGIPVEQPIQCGTCRISIPLAQVDSVRTARTESVGIAAFGVVTGAIAGLMLITLALRGT